MASYTYVPRTSHETLIIQMKYTFIPKPYTSTNDVCFACAAVLPYDWPTRPGHYMRGTCSEACGLTRRTLCKWMYCHEVIAPWAESYPFCCYSCESDDYEDRLDCARDYGDRLDCARDYGDRLEYFRDCAR